MIDIKQVMLEEDVQPHFDYGYNLGRNPSRGKLETMCEALYGSLVPPKDARFTVRDLEGDWFIIIYNKTHDEFVFEKLTVR